MFPSSQLLPIVPAIAALVFGARLLALGLAKGQRALLGFLTVLTLGYATLGMFPEDSDAYFWTYMPVQLICDIAAVALLRELCVTIIADYPGIQTATRRLMNGAFLVASIASVFVTAAYWRPGASNQGHLVYAEALHWWLQFSLAVIIISVLLFLSHYPRQLRKNTYTTSYFFSAVILTDGADTLWGLKEPLLYSKNFDLAAPLAVALILFIWAALMRREEAVVRTFTLNTAKEDQMLRGLDALNRALTRIGHQ